MEIVLAEELGFCFGVRRAIELAEAEHGTGHSVTTLGPLVHNPQEVERMAELGIRSAETPDEVSSDAVVIRAHGARPETFTELEARHIRIIDATCPFVTTSQRIAREMTDAGYTLVIVGHPDHPEVQGILGYATHPAYVVTQPEEVAQLPAGIEPGVIGQTTVNEQTFREVVAAIAARYPAHKVRNTVCSATRKRQEAARRLAAEVDAVLVVGGRHSSNTNRLAEICQAICPRTFLVETADEIEPGELAGVARIGITAGASTPNWLIRQVVARLAEITAISAPA